MLNAASQRGKTSDGRRIVTGIVSQGISRKRAADTRYLQASGSRTGSPSVNILTLNRDVLKYT
jgi:hypothetical protein